MRILGKAWIVQLELLPRFLDELLQVGWGDGERGALRLDVGLFDVSHFHLGHFRWVTFMFGHFVVRHFGMRHLILQSTKTL